MKPPRIHYFLERAVEQFGIRSRQRMADASERDTPTTPLFHYTSEAALHSIVESEKFWFTSIYYMDDVNELDFGFGVSHSTVMNRRTGATKIVEMFLREVFSKDDLPKLKKIFEF